MDPIEKQERKREAWRRVQAQRERVRRLRLRVLAGSLIAFVLLWGVVFGQMLSGNDPVLGGKATALTASTKRRHPIASGTGRSAMAPAGGEDEEGAQTAGETIETTDPEELEVEPEPVTTSQS